MGWWKLNGNTKDSTPYANNGTDHGATHATDRAGTANSAYSFNGTGNYIQTNAAGLPSGSAARSAFAWVYATGYPSGGSGLSMIDSFGENAGVDLNSLSSMGVNSNGKLFFAGNFNDYTSNVTLPLNSWHLVGYTYAAGSSNVTLWYDGVPTTHSLPSGALATVPQAHQIGRYTHGGDYWSGSISDLRIYNRALSQQDITNLYNSYNSQVNLYSPPGSGGNVNLTAGLIGYWPFNGNGKDATPYQNNGTVNGATLTTDRFGRPNSAYSFDGISNNIVLGSAGSLTAIGQPGLTISAWIKPSALTGGVSVVGSNPPALLWTNGSNLDNGLYQNASWNFRSSTSNPLTVNQWQLVTLTYDGASRIMYVNGAQVHASAFSGNIDIVPNTFWAVGRATGGASYFAGSIDDVRIYNRALSAAEVQALYNLPD